MKNHRARSSAHGSILTRSGWLPEISKANYSHAQMDAGGPSCKALQSHQRSSDEKLHLVLPGNTVSLSDFHLLLVGIHELFAFPWTGPMPVRSVLIALVGS